MRLIFFLITLILLSACSKGGGSSSPNPPEPLPKNGQTLFLFAAQEGSVGSLWKTDGTKENTLKIIEVNEISKLFKIGNLYFFSADNGTTGPELWRSDGTSEGTFLIKDIRPGSIGSGVDSFLNYNGVLIFRANDGTSGSELWRSDGTTEGTYRIKDINPTGSGVSPNQQYFIYQNKIYFSANHEVENSGGELWVSDGTDEGTSLVKEIRPGTSGSDPSRFILFNDKMYFFAYNPPYRELWESDGTTAGTVLVKTGVSFEFEMKVLGDKIILRAEDSLSGNILSSEPWISNGTSEGTMLLKNISETDQYCSCPTNYTVFNSKIYFTADDLAEENDYSLWVSDGTELGTTKFLGLTEQNSNPSNFIVHKNNLFLTINSASSRTNFLIKIDEEENLSYLTDNQVSVKTFPSMISLGEYVYFWADDGVHGEELWRTDGTVEGTFMLKDINYEEERQDEG